MRKKGIGKWVSRDGSEHGGIEHALKRKTKETRRTRKGMVQQRSIATVIL